MRRIFHPRSCLRRIVLCIFLVLLFLLVPFASPICVDIFWIQHSPSADPLFQADNGGDLVYINQSGKIVVHLDRPAFLGNLHGEFHDGLLLFWEGGRSRFLNERGKIVAFPNVDKMGEFSEGLAAGRDKATQKWGFINTQGDFLIPPSYQESEISEYNSFSDGMTVIRTSERDGFKAGFLDRTGAVAIEAKLLESNPFHEGVARVIIEGPCKRGTRPCSSFPGIFVLPGFGTPTAATPFCKYAFIDKAGHPLFPQRFDDAKDFSEDLAPVKIDGKWGFIDKTGAIVIKPEFESAESFSDGLALVNQDGLSGFIAHDGTMAIAPQFKHAEDFVDGLALVGTGWPGGDNKFWYIDHSGRQAIPDSFPLATSFFKGLAHVRFSEGNRGPQNMWMGKFGYIDRTGKSVFTYNFNRR